MLNTPMTDLVLCVSMVMIMAGKIPKQPRKVNSPTKQNAGDLHRETGVHFTTIGGTENTESNGKVFVKYDENKFICIK